MRTGSRASGPGTGKGSVGHGRQKSGPPCLCFGGGHCPRSGSPASFPQPPPHSPGHPHQPASSLPPHVTLQWSARSYCSLCLVSLPLTGIIALYPAPPAGPALFASSPPPSIRGRNYYCRRILDTTRRHRDTGLLPRSTQLLHTTSPLAHVHPGMMSPSLTAWSEGSYQTSLVPEVAVPQRAGQVGDSWGPEPPAGQAQRRAVTAKKRASGCGKAAWTGLPCVGGGGLGPRHPKALAGSPRAQRHPYLLGALARRPSSRRGRSSSSVRSGTGTGTR